MYNPSKIAPTIKSKPSSCASSCMENVPFMYIHIQKVDRFKIFGATQLPHTVFTYVRPPRYYVGSEGGHKKKRIKYY